MVAVPCAGGAGCLTGSAAGHSTAQRRESGKACTLSTQPASQLSHRPRSNPREWCHPSGQGLPIVTNIINQPFPRMPTAYPGLDNPSLRLSLQAILGCIKLTELTITQTLPLVQREALDCRVSKQLGWTRSQWYAETILVPQPAGTKYEQNNHDLAILSGACFPFALVLLHF